MTASARQRFIEEVPPLPKPVCAVCDLAITNPQPLRRPSALSTLSSSEKLKSRTGGGRNARATSFALARVIWKIPRRLTLANRRLPLALPQSFSEIRNSHVFDEPTLSHFVALRNTKNFPPCAEPVDDVPSLWKPEEI